jgi:plasmid stabilization system protein ParE
VTPFIFARAAELELREAIDYYNIQKPGFGREFSAAVDKGIDEVLEHPRRWPILTGNKRRYRLNRFPYGMVYRIAKDSILFIAVMHLKRRPGYWKGREAEFENQ